MIPANRRLEILACVFFSSACSAVVAQAQTATVVIAHNRPAGTIAPGQTMRVSASLSWSNVFQPARVVGDAIATPDVGTTSNLGAGLVGPGPLVHLGSSAGGSVLGADVGFGAIWIFFEMWRSPTTFLEYDWTAPSTPGPVEFSWRPAPTHPLATFYTSAAGGSTSIPTTYLGTSITVIPAPAATAAFAGAVLALASRRRRHVD